MGSNAGYSISMRFGSILMDKIKKHCLLVDESRNTWLVNAAHILIERGRPRRIKTTASEILFNKQSFILRMDPLTAELVDEACDEAGVNRTIWMMDAALTRLAEQPINKLMGK